MAYDPMQMPGFGILGEDDLMSSFGQPDPSGDPNAATAAAAAQAQALETPATQFITQGQPLLTKPSLSKALFNAGIALIEADARGEGAAGTIASGLKGYSDSMDAQENETRQERRERLAEYELMGRIRERHMTELTAGRKTRAYEELKKTNPELASLIDADPESASKIIAEKLTASGKPFEGTSSDAQDRNILLTGDPGSPEYLSAYNNFAQPKRINQADGSVITIQPDMRAYRPPSFKGYGVATTGEEQPKMDQSGGVTYGDPVLTKIQGYDLAPNARPTTDDAKKAKDVVEAHNAITALMDERRKLLEPMIGKDGKKIERDFSVGSKDAENIEQNTKQILLKVKNLEQTGALDQGSVDVIGPALGDPVNRGIDIMHPIASGRRSYTKSKGGSEFALEQFKSGQDFIDNTLQASLNARGYVKASNDAPPQDTAAAPASVTPAPVSVGIARPKSKAEYDALPPGTPYIHPKTGTKKVKG